MKIFKLLYLKFELKILKRQLEEAKTKKPEIVDGILSVIDRISREINTQTTEINKERNRYETIKSNYDNLRFDRCFMFALSHRLMHLQGEDYAFKSFNYKSGSYSRGDFGMDEYNPRTVIFSILARKEVIDTLGEKYGDVSSTRQVMHIIDKLIGAKENIFVFLSDNMHHLPDRIANCPQCEINTTDDNLWPITLYEPSGTSKSDLVIRIKEYAKQHGTDFDISTFIDNFKTNKYLEKK